MEEDEDIGYLRYTLSQLVRVWVVLEFARNTKFRRENQLVSVCADLCSDKLRNSLYELANKRSWKLGFEPSGTKPHEKRFRILEESNEWFAHGSLHYRNCSGSHFQRLDTTNHMYQQFGYKDEREWKKLTKGLAACISMFKMMDGQKDAAWWRKIKDDVRKGKDPEVHWSLVRSYMKDRKNEL